MTQATRNNFIVLAILAAVVAAAMVLVYVPQQRELARLSTAISQEKVRMSDNASLCSAVPAMIRMRRAWKRICDRRATTTGPLAIFINPK